MPVIVVNDLAKRYGEVIAVDGVSFAVEEGEIFGILGQNGAGKTTTVECIAGMRRPDRGSVDVLGLDPVRERDELRRVVGIQLQRSELPDKIKVREALELYASFYESPADTAQLLEDVGLRDKRDDLFKNLSGGQRQRLSTALALVGNPRVAILDELTTGLDPQARRDAWSLVEDIRGRGVTVLLVTHFMEEAERLCDRVALFDAGRVVALDTPAGLVARVAEEQTIRFTTHGAFDEEVLRRLPAVRSVTARGRDVLVTGTGDLLLAVVSALSTHGITATELRMDQATLDDAFLALVGKGTDG